MLPKLPIRKKRTTLAVGALALVGIGTLAIAGPESRTIDAETVEAGELSHPGEPLPAPAMGTAAFGMSASTCVSADEVSMLLGRERDAYGGEVIMVADGQVFAKVWRDRAGVDQPVVVTGVVAHVMPAEDEAIADVVEIGADGCAVSRTLMTGAEWQTLIEYAGQAGAFS